MEVPLWCISKNLCYQSIAEKRFKAFSVLGSESNVLFHHLEDLFE